MFDGKYRLMFVFQAILMVAVISIACHAQSLNPELSDSGGETLVPRRYVLPDDTGVLNVKEPRFGASGDGVTDDTDAIVAAIRFALDRQSRYATPPFVYFPEGTYLISDSLESKVSQDGWSGGWRAGLILLGESRENTVIKLRDRADDFGEPKRPRAVIVTGSENDANTKPGDKPVSGGGNRAFRQSVLNLTIDIGVGNPGAVGIDYVANNRGAIEAVTIRSSDPQRIGHTGLKLTRNWPGPCLVKDVEIVGFDRGIQSAHYQYSVTFEHITLLQQRKAGVINDNNVLVFRNLTSENVVPVIQSTKPHGHVTVVEGTFTGGREDVPAVESAGRLYLRDIDIIGYGKAVQCRSPTNARDLPLKNRQGYITIYTTDQIAMGGAKPEPMRLSIKETPLFWTTDRKKWGSPHRFLEDPSNT
ncbi:MAG: glycoside hydrolase family 55 protein, partial [Planctomycetota bacterium]